jgi:nucleoside-diphosphate kinase
MKSFFFLTLMTSFVLQMALFSQPNYERVAPQIEMQVRGVPSDYRQDNEGVEYGRDRYEQNFSTGQQGMRPNAPMPSSVRAPNQAGYTIVDNMPQRKVERTLSILKPDAVRNRHIGDIISRYEDNGLRVVAIKMVKLNPDQAAQFYDIHRDRPFFKDLVQFMSSGPVVIMVLEGDQAVSKNRQLMGATDPSKADKGTIRADFAESVSQNAVHGSDSLESANKEIPFFFKPNEIYSPN